MTNRDWFCLALRILGIWLLVRSIEEIVPNLIFMITANQAGLAPVAFTVFWLIERCFFGLLLLLFAPAIAARFYPSNVPTEPTLIVDEAKPLRIGIQLLGVYALLMGLQSGAGVIQGLLSGNNFGFSWDSASADFENRYLQSLLTFGLNIAFAAVLLMWNEGVVELIAKFRYVPERDAEPDYE